MLRAKSWQMTSFLKMMTLTLLSTLALITTGLTSTPLAAAPPGDFQTSLVLGDGLDGPSGFEIAPDGRIFILERAGKIKIVKDGELLPTPFADLPSEDTGDRGLIGIAFDPDFGVSNHYVYFYYTGHDLLNHLVRFSAAEDVATDGPLELFRTSSPSTLLHVGGSIRFGPDGKLYFAVGDNGYGPNAQDLSNPHGKILRINRDGSIPADNPFAGQPGKLGAIWAYGFRNPWRFQFDSATGRLYGGDVGDFTGGSEPHRQGRQLRLARARRYVSGGMSWLHQPPPRLSACRRQRRRHRRPGLPE
jgi:glucose/arabinose dehydrogenase